VKEQAAAGGRASIDPVVFFKRQWVLCFAGLRSERQLMRVVADRLSLRWYVGYNLDQPLPDHARLTRSRERIGLPLCVRFFTHIVALGQQAGLVWGADLIVDGTKGRANAASDALLPRWYAAAKAHLEDRFAHMPDEAAAAEPDPAVPSATTVTAEVKRPDPAAPQRLPFAGTTEAEQHLAATTVATWRLLDASRLDPSRPASGS
jgi:transposase